jgi:hypothetical protein
MSRHALEVGAFTWTRVQRLHDPDPTVHWQLCERGGLVSAKAEVQLAEMIAGKRPLAACSKLAAQFSSDR